MYAALPPQFRETQPVIGDLAHDIFGFQSANIQATLQLLRMVLSPNEVQGVDEKCDVAGHVLRVFSKVPVEYLKAISSPLVCRPTTVFFSPATIADVFSCITWVELAISWARSWKGASQKPPTSGFVHCCKFYSLPLLYKLLTINRLEMADLLHRLESGLRRSTGTSERLKAQVNRIDEYMSTKRYTTTLSAPPRPPVIPNPENVQGELVSPVYHQGLAPIQAEAPLAGLEDPIAHFQLPPELLDDWPWPFDMSMSEGVYPLAFVK
jgi:hypothetical protein